ncbi:hypothetical protein J2Z57_002361 [Formosa algae]|uniref:Uncharacterized protein n=1 Tax=Formosa algae TaxID=225843 RepID=A0A9X1C9P8_9FLAO|nr:hypothetical protein [Formosa algae]MDQ0335909.1 hypothetical protein [Formosa algae]
MIASIGYDDEKTHLWFSLLNAVIFIYKMVNHFIEKKEKRQLLTASDLK